MTKEQFSQAVTATVLVVVLTALYTFIFVWIKNHHEFRMTCMERGGDVVRSISCKLPTHQKDADND